LNTHMVLADPSKMSHHFVIEMSSFSSKDATNRT